MQYWIKKFQSWNWTKPEIGSICYEITENNTEKSDKNIKRYIENLLTFLLSVYHMIYNTSTYMHRYKNYGEMTCNSLFLIKNLNFDPQKIYEFNTLK